VARRDKADRPQVYSIIPFFRLFYPAGDCFYCGLDAKIETGHLISLVKNMFGATMFLALKGWGILCFSCLVF